MPVYTEVKDSGKREEFSTGSRRDTREGKGRFDLISPHFLRRLAVHLENGARKYGDRNWEKGQPQSRYLDSALRHLNKHLAGERDEDHLTAAAWNIQAMIHQEELRRRYDSSLFDLPEVHQLPNPVVGAKSDLLIADDNQTEPPAQTPKYRYFTLRGSPYQFFRVRETGTDQMWTGSQWGDAGSPWSLQDHLNYLSIELDASALPEEAR